MWPVNASLSLVYTCSGKETPDIAKRRSSALTKGSATRSQLQLPPSGFSTTWSDDSDDDAHMTILDLEART